MARKRRTYTPEFKAEAVKLVTEQGYSVAEAARFLGIKDNLIRTWKQAPGRPQGRVGGGVVKERVGIQEHGVPGLQVRESHGSSSKSRSGCTASRRSCSGSPFQPRMP